jgi:hypothetical protein
MLHSKKILYKIVALIKHTNFSFNKDNATNDRADNLPYQQTDS